MLFKSSEVACKGSRDAFHLLTQQSQTSTPRPKKRPPSRKALQRTPTTSATQDLNTDKMQSLRTLRSLPRFTSARAFSTTSPRNLAKMQLIGRLADAPEMTPTASGREITRFALGVSTGPKDENGNRGVSWFNVASFIEGPQRDFLLGLQKG